MLLLEQFAPQRPPPLAAQSLMLPDDDEEEVIPTNAGITTIRPRLTEPVVYQVKKAGNAANALALGITIGRTGNNDICIDDESISRFHGYFEHDPLKGLWRLIDMGSLNGTTASGVRLASEKPYICAPQEQLIIGKVPVLFLVPDKFFAYVATIEGAR